MRESRIRIATTKDADKLVDIYAPYVQKTAVTFEYTVPTAREFGERIGRVLQNYPYLVAQRDGEPVGYAYADAFHIRAAYQWAAETTVYVREDQRHMGIGAELYRALENALTLQNVLNLNACIAYSPDADPYLTQDSMCFHRHSGYRLAGEFHKCGYKFGRWYNMVWMEKHIAGHRVPPPVRKTFDEIKELFAQQYQML